MPNYLTRKQSAIQGIGRKLWKRTYKKPGKLKQKRIHIHKTQDGSKSGGVS